MESPVTICLGAALVVNLLLLLGTTVSGNVLPQTTPVTVNNKTRYEKINTTDDISKPNTLDITLNELNPKDSVSEEHTEKNAKYKDRGRVRYLSQLKSSTESPLRRVKTSTEAVKLIIVTPTPEAKKPVEIIDSMRTYKKAKMSASSSSTTTKSVEKEVQSIEEYDNEEDEEEKESFEKFTSNNFHEKYFTIPSFDDDKDSFSNKIKQDYSSPSYSFSNFFPKESSFGYSESSNNNNYNSASFFDFDSDLTTPKNDFFDKKYQAISGSIIKKLESIKSKSLPPNITNVQKIVKENVGLEKLTNSTPSNKSTVIIKNTKEIRLSDNEGAAGNANKALSDVQGTSIYYEMSVLSTETYAINHSNDYDCDNDTLPADPTISTSSEEELASIKATKPTIVQISTRPPFSDPTVHTISNVLPSTSEVPSSNSTVSISTQNSISSTEATSQAPSNTSTRNINYSKRLNLDGVKNSPNSVTLRPVISSYSPYTRKFYHTTPRNRPVWMAPKRNATKLSYRRNTPPTTIYSEHFSIKDKMINTLKPKVPGKAMLTTVSSEIDPVLESEIGGIKKVVHSQLMSDNSIPSLWKRGSTKYTTSTATSVEVSNLNEMEIPPTSIAWALAALKNPSSIPSSVPVSSSTHKSVDENELQKVGEQLDKVTENTFNSTVSTTTTQVNEDVNKKVITDVDQNKLNWQLTSGQILSSSTVAEMTTTEAKSEKFAAESNISVQSTAETQTTPTIKNKSKIFKPAWFPITVESQQTTQSETIPPVNATRSTGFESITKLSSDVTTPKDEIIESSETNDTITEEKPTKDYEITTIRFSYVPTEPVDFTELNDNDTESTTETAWHPIIPTRTRFTITNEIPITTYRPKYITTTEFVEESTIALDTTPQVIDVSSHVLENKTDKLFDITETIEFTTITKPTTTITTEEVTTEATTYAEMATEVTTDKTIHPTTVQPTTPRMYTTTTVVTTTPIPTTTVTTTTPEETTTIVVEVVTEINTERERRITTTEKLVTEIETDNEVTTDCSSEENDNSNEIINQNIPLSSSSTSAATTTMPSTTENTLRTTEKPRIITITEKLITTTEEVEDIAQIATTERVATEVITKETIVPEMKSEVPETTSKPTTQISGEIKQTTNEVEETSFTSDECSTETDVTTKAVNDLEDLTNYSEEMTTEASRVISEESGTGAAIAIAVSTIGVIALVLLIGLLLVVRRRGRRGIYAQRCTPVSLDAYSLDSVSVGHRKGNHRLRASKRSYGNPAYDDEVTSHPMQYPALANFALDVESITAEFAEIPSVSVRPEEVPPGCEDKNRYSNVLPLPETRVPLTRLDNDPTTEYINANYITGPGNIRNYYIACQAPLTNTVVDFWRMIWEQNSRLVVMLTEYMENGVEKCYEYLPPSEITDNKRMFGDFKVILKKREQRDKYAITSIKLINLSTRTWREVTHLWYFWPAKGVPDDYDSIIDFLSEMRSYMKISQTAKEYDDEGVEVIYGDQNRSSYGNLAKLRSDEHSSGNGVNVYSPAKAEEVMRRHANNGTLGRMKAASEIEGVRPCVVTCSSGAGRAAVLIALDISARALAAGCADVPRAVRHLRAQRPHSLSNRHHYILLYKVLSEYGNKLMGGGVDTI